MWPYWLMFLVPTLAAWEGSWRRPVAETGLRPFQLDQPWWLMVLVLSLLIGFRFQVGADWETYLDHFYAARGAELTEVLGGSDPGYHLLNWLSAMAGWDIFGVNLMGGLFFAMGLAIFCRTLPRPWLALAVAVPYLVIVVAMGYTRQGIALGLVMLGLVALGRDATAWFVLWVLLGATFHKTAVVLLPIAALASANNRYWKLLWVGAVSLASYGLLLEDSVGGLYKIYVEAEYQSQGALIRLLMCALPAAILLLWRHRFLFTPVEAGLWFWFALIAMVLLVLVIVSPATTAVDRIGLYLLPLQLVVFSHLPDVFGRPAQPNRVWVGGILLYAAAVQFFWLNYAAHSFAWVPYRFYPLMD